MAIKDDTLITVRNRNNGTTGYTLDNGFHRDFSPKEEKKVPFSELKALQYAPGGAYILEHYLIIENKEALDLLNMKVEPEYNYTEVQIKDILLNGSYDQFADFLDFAPKGALEIAKRLAIELKIPDINKREMLSKKTGLNINNAINVNEIMNAETETKEEDEKKRRVPVEETKTEDTTPSRRVNPPKYNVVSK